ncbi:MAG TPA: MBL fold metallo-hydrolase [Verrucomicrobiota bacterium]|nr:MBL fold metallo-hydrolase [Verrucomicrobiota bacterium]HRT57015.1 MBL fold metallo-hydrolase [Candidatus Paceibacterota bacterium]
MSDAWVITVLVENSVHRAGLQAEHGLAVHLQAGDRAVLFDTGQTGLVLRNAAALGIGWDGLDAIVLSHGHYDHTGGLEALHAAAPHARRFLHPAALAPKFSRGPDGAGRYIGMPRPAAQALVNDPAVTWTPSPVEVIPGLFLTGAIPRNTGFEDTGGDFFLDPACTRPDPLEDDQALFFDTPQGLVILLGCGHSGVVNTVEHIRSLTGRRPIHTLLGGLHLLRASAERMRRTLAAFHDWQPRQIAAGHCTGLPALARLGSEFPTRCLPCAVGTRLTVPAP